MLRVNHVILRSLVMLSWLLVVPLSQAGLVEPRQVIEERYESLLGLVEGQVLVPGMPEEQLLALMEKELTPVVDFPRMARKVMGKFARGASDEQLALFTTVFKRTLVSTYSKGLDHLDQLDHVNVVDAVVDSKGSRAKVSSDIVLRDGRRYKVIYSLFLKDAEGWLVENIIVEGVNIGIVFRNQFAHYMEQYGQNIDQVIEHWGD